MSALFGSSGFVVAFAVALVVDLALLLGRWRVSWVPAAGVAAALGTLAGIAAERKGSPTLIAGLVILAVGGFATAHRHATTRVVALIPGAAILGFALPDGMPEWAAPVLGGTTIIGAVLLTRFDAAAPRPFTPLLALSALGVYGAVPDTDSARAFVGALLAASLLSLLEVRQSAAATAAEAGLFGWVCVAGGQARPASVVGAIGCVGVLGLAPLLLRSFETASSDRRRVVACFLVQGPLVLVCSRVAGLRTSATLSAVIVIGVWAMAAIVLRLVPASTTPPAEPTVDSTR